ncbi:acyl carrier protein [Halomonas sp. IOP_31]|uniref:acyl carrier protein n=1 Tax=Halomonas sp. IOP_31 TaxID=2876584 RepID=UPI001E3EEB01|nr:acyl carrier protein [Halomonas sp. IOP_31]MCD6008198.1 acyl carrier protein [Halomonas sp. IOP_31]|tara:strand:+ start:411 stop:659 length:249 start_codon:yes stop_codon:yes gene_type:complete
MPQHEQVLERLMTHLERLAPPDSNLRPDVDMVSELGLDSVKVMDLMLDAEDEFDISVPLNVLADIRTPNQLAQAINKLLESR